MPPRYAYWTIIAGGLPTAFRAADRDELMPTFQRIKEKHPDAEMKWFARGKLWESQDAARAADKRGGDRRGRPAADLRRGPSGAPKETRSRDWRPGGDHRDPRQKFTDAKKQRNAALRKERWQRKTGEGVRSGESVRPQVSGFRGAQGSGPRDKKPWMRAQGTEEPRQPQRPRGPDREPKPNEVPEPTPPPRPDVPVIPPSAPPERGGRPRRPFRPRGNFRKGPRR
jgi:hypothetical protein